MREKLKTYHFIGIGGIGMSGIARLLLEQGHKVQGSDAKTSSVSEDLERHGAKIFIGHSADYVETADIVVYSSAITPTHPERTRALDRGIPVIHRSEALALLAKGKFLVAVAGTHGKTTTTSLVGMVLKEAGLDPTVVVGGWIEDFGGNTLRGTGKYMVIEADESDGSFLRYSPNISIITNIEEEHLDHYGSAAEIEKAYEDFLKNMKPPALWIGCAEDDCVAGLSAKIPCFRRYGFSESLAGLNARNIVLCPSGFRGVSFEVWDGAARLGDVRLKLLGRHNVLNSLAAISAGLALDIPFEIISLALSKFKGAGRRFDVKYEDENYLVVDDYAHHPTEIEKTLEAAKSLEKNRIVALFQPHRFSRTEFLMELFKKSFTNADKIILTDIYAASEKPRPGISGEKLAELVRQSGHPDVLFASRDSLADVARRELQPGDLVMVMGAGDISQVATQISACLKLNGKFKNIFSGVKGKVTFQEPLSKHTTLKVGGPAEFWIEPIDEQDLSMALRIASIHGLKVTIFGAGSNVLPSDQGIRGAVIHLSAPFFKQVETVGGRLSARAGVPNSIFIQQAVERGFGGFEFLSGIPGNIGGALAMNAGSHGQWIWPHVYSVKTMDSQGKIFEKSGSDFKIGYRRCDLKKEILLQAVFTFPKIPREEVQKKLEEYHAYRAKTQDLRHPSAGCMFKNPDIPGCSSGKLIDESGLKGLCVGRAQVSLIHANFIVNLGGATSREIMELMHKVRQEVYQKKGIMLESEVKILE